MIIATSVVGITFSIPPPSSCRYCWIAAPHSCTMMIGIRSGPATMALQPEPRANARQPTPMPSKMMPAPSATPKDVTDTRSLKMTAEKTMQKKVYRMKSVAPAATLPASEDSAWWPCPWPCPASTVRWWPSEVCVLSV